MAMSRKEARHKTIPKFLASHEAAMRWVRRHHTDYDRKDPNSVQWAEDRAADYTWFAAKAYRDGEIVVYRAIRVPRAADGSHAVNLQCLGKSWSSRQSGAGIYGMAKRDGDEVLIVGRVSPRDVDWAFGFQSFLYYGEDQWEVSMLPNSPVTVDRIESRADTAPIMTGPVLGNTGPSGEVWEMTCGSSARMDNPTRSASAVTTATSSARRQHDQAHDDELLAEELTHVPDERDAIEYVERARAAGAQGELRYIGAGAQGYVFADERGHAFKVARFDTASSHRLLSEEYHWLLDAGNVPEIRRLVAKAYDYHPKLGVLEREEIIGDPMRSWADESRLSSVHEKIAEALKDRWTAPEFKGDSYVRTSSGPVLVDAGFALRRGVLLINQAIQKLNGEDVGETPEDLAFAVRMESGRTIDPVTADQLATKLEQLPHERRANPIKGAHAMLLSTARRLPAASFGPAPDSPIRGRWTVAARIPIGLLEEIETRGLPHMSRGLSAEQRLDLLRATPSFKPIEIEVMPSGMYLLDGNHRLHVARERGAREILVQFFFPDRPRTALPAATHRVVHARKDNPTTVGDEPMVDIWIDRDATLAARTRDGKSIDGLHDLVATFAGPVPLYRIIDGEELVRIVRTRRVAGGFFAVPSERAHGASWAGSLDELVSWGRSWQGTALSLSRFSSRLGKDLFVLQIDGELRRFYHLGDKSFAAGALFDPHGPPMQPARIHASICNTGLGCSVPEVYQHDIVAIYRVTKKDELAAFSWDQAYAYAAKKPVRPVHMRPVSSAGVHHAGTIHGVDVEVYLDQDEYRPGSGFTAYGRPDPGEPYRVWDQRRIAAQNPYLRTYAVDTRDGLPVVRGARTRKAAVDAAARALELHQAPASPVDLLPRPKRGARKDNPTTIGDELILWHGGRTWQGPVEVQAGPIHKNQHGPGVYLTTSATTARKYTKGGGRVFRFALDPSLVLLDEQRLPVTEMVRWLREQPRLRGRDKVIHDLDRLAGERSTTDLPIYYLLNLLINHDAHGGAHGVAFARWMSELGIDAQIVSPPGKSDEDWLVLFNPQKVLSTRPARPDELVDTRVRR